MFTKFKQHLDQHFPEVSHQLVLIAVSGGLDSMVLANLFKEAGYTFAIAHCNFKLRANESDADEQFVVQWAQRHHIPIHVKKFDTKQYATSHKLNTQLAARELRYKWFSSLVQEHSYSAVLTAHHADDALETFLINLSRGTGLDGLTGIPEKNGAIVRPLLPFSRLELKSYAEENKLEWREDSSNATINYLRNRIRHTIVPNLKMMHPEFLHNFLRTQTYLRQNASLVASVIEKSKEELFEKDGNVITISIPELRKLHPFELYVHELFHPYGFSAPSVLDLLSSMSGKQLFSDAFRLLKDREKLILKSRDFSEVSQVLWDNGIDAITLTNWALTMETVMGKGETSSNCIYLDKETLKFPLLIRKWEKGDYFYPTGMQGKKKLSKFFKDEKRTLFEKEQQWLLCSGKDIVWVIGLRADRRFLASTTSSSV